MTVDAGSDPGPEGLVSALCATRRVAYRLLAEQARLSRMGVLEFPSCRWPPSATE